MLRAEIGRCRAGYSPRRSRLRAALVSSSTRSPTREDARSSCRGRSKSARNPAEERWSTSLPAVPRNVESEEIRQTRSVRRCSAASRSSRASAWLAWRTSSLPRPDPRRRRRRRRRRAPLHRHEVGKPVDEVRGATEPSGVQDVVAVEEVQRRLRLRHAYRLRRATSNSSSAAATLTFSDSTRPASGIATSTSHCFRTSGRMPLPSAPSTSSTPPPKSASHRAVGASATAAPELGALHFGDEAGEVGHDSNRKVFDGTRRDAADGRRDACRTVRRQHEARCAAPSALRQTAPRLCGSVTPSRQTSRGCGRSASS